MVSNESPDKLPQRVIVKKVITSRYQPGSRPLSWDERKAGLESIEITSGQTLLLYSGGGQSSPASGWELLLKEEIEVQEQDNPSAKSAFSWTLYGLGSKAP